MQAARGNQGLLYKGIVETYIGSATPQFHPLGRIECPPEIKILFSDGRLELRRLISTRHSITNAGAYNSHQPQVSLIVPPTPGAMSIVLGKRYLGKRMYGYKRDINSSRNLNRGYMVLLIYTRLPCSV